MRAVSSTGYAGPLSQEVFNDQFRRGSPATITRDGHRSLLALIDYVRRREAFIRLPAPELPAGGNCLGIEFVKFTTSEAEASDLEAFLRMMGFVHAGDHVSKRVAHWRQNGINILINTKGSGLAHCAYEVHETSVCDIALTVDDATSAIERARGLGAGGRGDGRGQG